MASDHSTSASSPRPRSRGFPVVPLDEAADVVRRAGRYGQSHPESAFAQYMGHTTTNSGAFKQRFAAMRSWGLVAVQRSSVVFTDLGKRLAYPVSAEDEALALREAFLSASAFSELYHASAKGQELETAELANRAVHHLGVSPKSKAKFADCFTASAKAAGVAREPAPGKLVLLGGDRSSASTGPGSEPLPPDQLATVSGPERPVTSDEPDPVIHQRWPVAGGSVSFEIRLDRPLPAAAFGQLGGIFESVERLVGQLGDGPEAD